MHMLLAALSAVACGALGTLYSRRMSLRHRLIAAWDEALQRMEIAVLHGGALGEILTAGAGEQLPLLRTAAEQLRLCPAMEREAWLSALCWGDLLNPPDREILAAALMGLWAADREEQLRALRYGQAQWRLILETSRERQARSAGLYSRLGWLAGAALFILAC